MKKIFILFAIIILFLGCEFTDSALPNTTTQKPLDIRYSTVPDATVQKALDIAYNEITNINLNDVYPPQEYLVIKRYLENQNYKKNYKCSISDISDVQGEKYIKVCLLKNANNEPSDLIHLKESPDVLVMAEQSKEPRDIVKLIFFSIAFGNTQKTEKGFPFMQQTILVNLKTKKIGTL